MKAATTSGRIYPYGQNPFKPYGIRFRVFLRQGTAASFRILDPSCFAIDNGDNFTGVPHMVSFTSLPLPPNAR